MVILTTLRNVFLLTAKAARQSASVYFQRRARKRAFLQPPRFPLTENGLFSSFASNLVPNDTNGSSDIFVRDMNSGQTQRISITSNGK
jgi:hypothetical protein